MALTNNSKAAPGRRWIWVVGAGLILIVVWASTRPAPLKVHAAAVQRGPIRSMVSTNGKVEPIQNFEAHAPIATTVKRLLVREGDRVRKGQPLLELDDADIRTQAARAEAQVKTAQADEAALKNSGTQEEVLTLDAQLVKARAVRDVAQRNLEALRHLQQDGASSAGEVRNAEELLQSAQADLTLLEQKKKDRYSSPEIEKVRAQAAEAKAAYNAAEEALAKSSVRAPFDGVVYSLPVKQGAFVQAGDLLLQEGDLSQVQIRTFVDEPDLGRLQPGQKVEITWDAMPGRTWTGTVGAVPSTVKLRVSRNVGEMTCAVDNHDGRLLPNINVGVTIVTAEQENVLTVQRDALRNDDSTPYVYLIADSHLKRQPVQIALQNLTRVEITAGLSEGQPLALPAEESRPLVDGAAVRIVP